MPVMLMRGVSLFTAGCPGFVTKLVLVYAPWFAMALCLMSCVRPHELSDRAAPVVHNGLCDVWPDSIDLRNGVVVRAMGDSLLQVRVEGNVLRTIHVPAPAAGTLSFSSDFPLFDALFRLEVSQPPLPAWNQFTPYALYLNPFAAADGSRLLESRLKNGLVVPMEGRRYSWPVVNDNAAWLLAAAELCKAGGSRRWLRTVGEVAANVLQEDCRVSHNQATGLFYGVPRYMTGADACFPAWMEPSDVSRIQTLAVNVLYWSALDGLNAITLGMARRNEHSHLPELPVDADSLRHAINREFWMPGVGVYSAMLYGVPLYPLQLDSSDNLAQAMAVLTGMASPDMAATIMRRTPVGVMGVAPLSPCPVAIPGRDSGVAPVVRAVWAAAAARAGVADAYDAALGSLLMSAAGAILSGNDVGHGRFGNSLSGLVLRGLLGIDLAFDGIRFAPSVPHGMPGVKRISGLRYRHSSIDITISGTGNAVADFRIDGQPSAPFFPASADGHHTIEITLSGENAVKNGLLVDDFVPLPQSPTVEWASPREAAIFPVDVEPAVAQRGADVPCAVYVYINGVLTEEISSYAYTLPDYASPVTVQFCNMNACKRTGFSARPYMYVPDGHSDVVALAGVARAGTKILADRKLSARYVESDRQRNRNMSFIYEAPDDGDYLVNIHYLSGLGVVNPRRRTALRALVVDGTRRGVFVCPQRTAMLRDHEVSTDWQAITSFSNPLRVHLRKGANRMELRLYQPSPVYVDPTANTLVADYVRIIRL